MTNENGNGDEKTKLSGVALGVAVVALVAFAAFVWFMILQRGAEETPWTRLAWLFASVEAIAFAAAGALFGSSVQRQQTEREKKRADNNEEAATNGKRLATVLVADDPQAGPGLESLDQNGRQAVQEITEKHADLARRLFPDA